MMQKQELTIGVLCLTAVIMLTGLFVMNSTSQPAYAGDISIQKSDYIMVVGGLSNNEELLYLIDTTAGGMGVIWFDVTRRQINISEFHNLAKMRKEARKQDSGSTPPQPHGRRGRGRRP